MTHAGTNRHACQSQSPFYEKGRWYFKAYPVDISKFELSKNEQHISYFTSPELINCIIRQRHFGKIQSAQRCS